MSPRSACGWPEWEEKNFLSWLDAHRDLSWKALSDAYYEEYQVDRSVESLRGKKYHILRKQRRAGAKIPGRSSKQKRPGDVRRSLVDSGSRSTLPDNTSAQRNIDKWFQTILAADPSQSGDSDKPAKTTRSQKHADLLPQAAWRQHRFRTRLKEHDRRPGYGTMYIVSVPPGN
ncbi:hypothetical protein PCH_Pc19g00780 [Penicillium rubens Wisconsin 54-1255]|uniref:Uncharacterized protein n=1 Tax=Penicillium rubens (strain ATCC 28089 / DSM 1075 / NRRL 1951 / Wisconsin 54-1255) TaxID=500485 RepID=B6HD65_PENRW|nr:hypothetical protein PCH_Pc19g00780 [Penicillium rubens Wisconsin 54-1255]